MLIYVERKENLGQVEPPDGAAHWVVRGHCTKARKDCFEVTERFGVLICSELYASLLETTISMREQLYIHVHPTHILHMDQLNGMPRCTTEHAIRAR
jgi:hypothetical protein